MPSLNTSRRLLATLSAAPTPSASSSSSSSSLLPPYTHALPSASAGHAPSSAFRPPYTFVLPGNASVAARPSSNLKSKLQFKLLGPSDYAHQQALIWRAWAEELVSTEQGRARAQKAWVASIIALERAKSSGNHTPEVAFQSLGEHLRSETALKAIREIGSVVVRDVVPDGQATSWAKEILEQLEAREGHPLYWSEAQLAARSNPSILSANKQISAALVGEQADPFMDASAVRVGVAEVLASPRIGDVTAAWPNESLLAHLSLTATRATLPASAHSATYSLLRPLFRPLRSRLSFYHPSGYLDPANWAMLDASELPEASQTVPEEQVAVGTSSTEALEKQSKKWFPHLEGTWTSTDLAPGDVLYRQSSIAAQNPLRSGEEGLTLPVSPLPSVTSAAYVQAQRDAFEAGMPPAQAAREGSVAIEDARTAVDIATGGGRRAMGY